MYCFTVYAATTSLPLPFWQFMKWPFSWLLHDHGCDGYIAWVLYHEIVSRSDLIMVERTPFWSSPLTTTVYQHSLLFHTLFAVYFSVMPSNIADMIYLISACRITGWLEPTVVDVIPTLRAESDFHVYEEAAPCELFAHRLPPIPSVSWACGYALVWASWLMMMMWSLLKTRDCERDKLLSWMAL